MFDLAIQLMFQNNVQIAKMKLSMLGVAWSPNVCLQKILWITMKFEQILHYFDCPKAIQMFKVRVILVLYTKTEVRIEFLDVKNRLKLLHFVYYLLNIKHRVLTYM